MKRHEIVLSLMAVLGAGSCGGGTEGPAADVAVSVHGPEHPLGWLGGRARAASDLITFDDEGVRCDCGGMVVESALTAGPLATAGVRAGDVIVGVDDAWLPITEDPWLDLIGLVETTVSSGAEAVTLSLRRDGEGLEVSLPVTVKTLEEGLPLEVARFDEGVARTAAGLVPARGDDVGTRAWKGLARLAAGETAEDVELAAVTIDESLAVSDLVPALMFETERLGPLPAEVVTHLSAFATVSDVMGSEVLSALGNSVQFGGGGGAPHGGSISYSFSEGEMPPNLEDLLSSGDGSVQMFTIGGDDGMDPGAMAENLGLPEGTEFQVATPEEIEAMFGGLPEGGTFTFGEVEPLDLVSVLEEMAPERLGAMEESRRWLDALVARQGDDGSWRDEGIDSFRTTCDALVALGMAQRAGHELPAHAVERAVAFLLPALHDGEIAAHVATGGDRRDAVVKTLHAVRALELLGCSEQDDLLVLLNRFLQRARPGDFAAPADLLARALELRAGGVGDWQRFYDSHRLRLVAAQDPDGSFLLADETTGRLPGVVVGTLLLSLQHARTPLFLGTADNPLAPTIDGHGRLPESESEPEPIEEVEEASEEDAAGD